MASPELKFDRKLCNECAAQPQCSIGRFAVQFVKKSIEPQVDASRVFIGTFLDMAFDAIYDDPEAFDKHKRSIDDELSQTSRRYNQRRFALDEILATAYSAQELPSEALIERTLDQARQDFMTNADISPNESPTLDEFINMSKAAKEWRDDGQCIQDFLLAS
jgi:hypothetical protein